jgi:transcriptional regulator with XRE-family HTH domain
MGVCDTVSELSELLNNQPISARQAADLAQERGIRLPYGTIAGYWSGNHGRPTRQTLERIAAVLPIPLRRLQQAAWNATAPLGRYTPPPEADLLGERQRRALDELIKAMAEGAGSSGDPAEQK